MNQSETELEKFKDKKVPDAILLNSDDWGFGNFNLDHGSIKVFEEKLGKVARTIDRVVIVGQFTCMMRAIEYPATRLPKIMNALLDEKNHNVLEALFEALSLAVNSYLPTDKVSDFSKEAADFFLKKAKKESGNKDLQTYSVDKAIFFMSQKDNINAAAQWVNNNKIKVDDSELGCELSGPQKYDIVKKYWASSDFTQDEKNALKTKVFANDGSDAGKNVQKVLDWSLPDADLKKRLWDEITDVNSTDSVLETRLKIQGFWQKSQLELITPYFDKYYSNVAKLVADKDRNWAEVFIGGLSPAFMSREEDTKAFNALLEKQTDSEHFFTLFIKKQIELISVKKQG